MSTAIGVGSSDNEAIQVETYQFRGCAGCACHGYAIHVRACIPKYRIGAPNGFAHPGCDACRSVNLINIGIGAHVAYIKIAVLGKTDVLPAVAMVQKVLGAAKITYGLCLSSGRIDRK